MSLRLMALILVLVIVGASFIGCADDSRPKPQSTTFSDNGRSRSPDPEDQGPKKKTPSTPEQRSQQEADEVAPVLTKGKVDVNLKAYQVPEQLKQRLKEESADLVVPHSQRFSVYNQHLHISKEATMTFSGALRIPGKPDEAFELRCAFDLNADTWQCSEMYPTDIKVAEQRRLHATAICLDTYSCREMSAVELFVQIDGKAESQLFQTHAFSARQASSGDAEEDAQDDFYPIKNSETTTTTTAPEQNVRPKVFEKPTPEILPPPAVQQKEKPKDLTLVEIEKVMNDPNAALEITAPIPTPSPIKGKYSIRGVEKLRVNIGPGVPVQAIGAHNAGRLVRAKGLSAKGPGFVSRDHKTIDFGTDLTIKMLEGAAAAMVKTIAHQSPLVVGNISKKNGGELCKRRKDGSKSCHASHQTGLDVDIGFPFTSEKSDFQSVCVEGDCRRGILREFDEASFWAILKAMTCAENKPVIAIFVDQRIKARMCNWVKSRGEHTSDCGFRALQALKHEDGHHNHFHVRFRCPERTSCKPADVVLGNGGKGTGC